MTSQKSQFLKSPWDIVFEDDALKMKNFSGTILLGIVFAFLFIQFLITGIILLFWYTENFYKKRNIVYKKIIGTYPESFFFFVLLIIRNFYKKDQYFTQRIITALANKKPQEARQSLENLKNKKFSPPITSTIKQSKEEKTPYLMLLMPEESLGFKHLKT